MTDYGLLPTGFSRKPAAQIRADQVTAVRQINKLTNARIGPGSVIGNILNAYAAQTSLPWEAAEAVYHSFSRDSASGQSLDDRMSMTGKSRYLSTQSLTVLTLWTLAGSDVTVPAGNQASQSDTGVLWETTADAIIPAATVLLEDVVVADVEWQSDNIVRYTFPATDLSDVEPGMLLIVSGASVSGNNGAFTIDDVDDAGNYIDAINPQRSDATGDESGSDALATITNGVIDVAAQAINSGALEAAAQTIDTINTPLANWDGAVNLDDALTGRDRETDPEFKARVALELVIAQGSTLEAIKAKLRAVAGVTYVAGVENRTSTTDGDGNLPHSYRFTVVGGEDQDIVNAIGTYKAGGIATNGSESGTWTDPEGVAVTIYFDRVTLKVPYAIANLTTTGSYPVDGDDLVEAALEGMAFDHGEDVLNYEVVGAIAAANIPGITAVEVLLGWSDPPVTAGNLTVAATEQAQFQAAQITVNS